MSGQESGPRAEEASVTTPLLMGGILGWHTGFIFQEVRKLAATSVRGKDMKKAQKLLKILKSNQIPIDLKSRT
ncbi:hypothetical protein E2I00_008720 [Balaenoptera physalus]|uniref:Uncharacterized protein n=1 Tax=Balaenoptera physalus TaxID=9770 RepID=A0A6A1QEA3_BALPH|nr:hypothetical protein E2I00_008720 [Balaenoptera physalus]